MKRIVNFLFFFLALLPSVALATPQSDLMTQVQDTTDIGITMGDPIFQTQSLRLLDAIRLGLGGGVITVNQTPISTSGLTQYSLASAATTNATSIKASQGNIYNVAVFNNGASAAYIKFFNSASAPTPGSGTPVKRFMIPAGGGLTLNSSSGIQFSTGIAFDITGLPADNDTTAVALNQVLVNVDYK